MSACVSPVLARAAPSFTSLTGEPAGLARRGRAENQHLLQYVKSGCYATPTAAAPRRPSGSHQHILPSFAPRAEARHIRDIFSHRRDG